MIFNINKQTLDGKRMTLMELQRLMQKELDEGRDVIRTDGHRTWTQSAQEWRMEKEKELAEGQATATTSDGQTNLTTEERLLFRETLRALYRASTEERDETPMDGRTLLTEQMTGTDGQTETVAEQRTGTDVQETGTDGQMTTVAAVEDAMLMQEDPLACSLTASGKEVDPLALSPNTSRVASEFTITHYSAEETLRISPVKEVQKADDGCDMDSFQSPAGAVKKVVGRQRVVVADEDSDMMSIVSISSVDEDYSVATSSSRLGKGVKRGRKPVKGKGKAKKESSEDRKGRKKGKKGVAGDKDTPEVVENVDRKSVV